MFRKLFILMLVSCLVSAWPTSYSQPSCLSSFAVNGFNFTVFQSGSSLSCDSNNFYFSKDGEYVNLDSSDKFYLLNSTHLLANGSITWNTHAPSDSQNYSFNISGSGNGCFIANETSGAAANSIYINNLANCTLNYSTAHTLYNLSCLNSGTIPTAKTNITTGIGGTLYFQCNEYFYFPLFEDTPKTLGNQSSWNASNNNSLQAFTSVCRTSGSTSFLYSDLMRANASIPNSNPSCINTSPYFKTLIVYGSNTIVPKITFFPASSTGTTNYSIEAYSYYYDSTSFLSYLRNNSVAYILDQYNIWYTVPAIDVVDTSVVYTVSAFLASTGTTTSSSIPVIPSLLSCTESNGFYNITTNYSVAVTHLLYYWNSTTVNSSTAFSTNFSFLINLSNYPQLNYSVNGIPICSKGNSTSILGIAQFGTIDLGGASFIPTMIFVATVGIGLFNPFAMIFAVMFNDLFGIIELGQMVIVLIIAIASSIVMTAYDRTSLKSIVLYSLICVGILTQIFIEIGMDYSGLSSLSNGLGSFATCTQVNSQGILQCFDLIQFVQGTFTFMVSLFTLVLTFPFAATGYMNTLVCTYASTICVGGLFSTMLNLIALGMYFSIGLMAYQIIRNSFISP